MTNNELASALERLAKGTYDRKTAEFVVQSAIGRLYWQEAEIEKLEEEKLKLTNTILELKEVNENER